MNQNLNTTSFCELTGGHSGPVYKSKFTHDSKYLLSCGSDTSVYLWNVENEKNSKKLQPIYRYSGHLYSIWDSDIFSQLNLYATASGDNTVRLWSFDRLFPLRVYCGHNADINCVAFHPNGSYIATGSSDSTIRLWSVQSAECLRLFVGHQSRVLCLNFSPDGKYLASGSEDKIVKVWDLGSGALYNDFKGHNDMIYSVCFDNSSNFLCSTSGYTDKRVCFWSAHKIDEPQANLNELWMNLTVDFNITTTYCDRKDVFYHIGIRKSSEIDKLFNNDTKIKSKSNKTTNNLLKSEQNIKQESVTTYTNDSKY
jgi:WD40 repeat protein